jgi:hypothetical protein
MMTEYTFGDKQARNVLVQMVDSHDLSVMENEVASIRQMTGAKFYLIAMKVNRWNHDLSPWAAPAIFGDESFGDGSEDTLEAVLNPYSEETLAYNKLITGKFCIVSASTAVSRECYTILRSRNLFTHNIAWPKSVCYVTSTLGNAASQFTLLPFSFHYLKPEESVFLMANSPKTMEAYVQD